ncbi:amino acid/amide ABC transporter ATP-binding protein 2, HAAT family [Cognatiyoonia koreensis]|uniref:Amino acid/amide ABC transporter ATP-binding protein 2, HAAT family n=1 Tax=Cognatiyoonia koreensis TaxID=364200 RepID=A0A1I0RCC1_9RHOB|nr:urea ABC transporter ATP-binding subunit UrtE [Cognatiyoonia koreensis]SEW38304.1 amino acid/amide ABC transporter ATP-binding protein 2, HAAT family [Cognatiyoonia koreensis]
MLEVSNIDLKYGQSQILFDISIDAEIAQITALMGNNGVGKTSLLKAVSGRHPITGGQVKIQDKVIHLSSAYNAARAGIAYVPQGREIFPMMTVRENLETGFACLPKSDHDIPTFVFELFPVLREMQTRRGGDLSGGQQQQLAIARALITRPKVLLLDEPTEGIQPNVIQQIGEALETLRDQGDMAIVLVEQNADFAYRISDRLVVLEQGKVKRRAAKADYPFDSLLADLAL